MTDPISRLTGANRAFARRFSGPASVRPRRELAVVACMDARLEVMAALGLQPGDAHVLRNAGGIVTADVIRSLCLSQRVLGTRTIVLVHHTDCGLHGVSDEEFARRLSAETGRTPDWDVGGFEDVEESVRVSMRRLTESPFLPHRERIAGFVYHIDTGALHRVEPNP